MFETKRWQKSARRSHASSCCSSFTAPFATNVIDTCQFRLENCPRSLRSSFPGVDRVKASSVARSRRRCGKPPCMPLGLTGKGAYTSSAGPRAGSHILGSFRNLGTFRGEDEGRPLGLVSRPCSFIRGNDPVWIGATAAARPRRQVLPRSSAPPGPMR